MKICERCRSTNPDGANFCMSCGSRLASSSGRGSAPEGKTGANWPLFWATLIGSLALSWLLMVVFHLPVFILGAVLPLVWFGSRK